MSRFWRRYSRVNWSTEVLQAPRMQGGRVLRVMVEMQDLGHF